MASRKQQKLVQILRPSIDYSKTFKIDGRNVFFQIATKGSLSIGEIFPTDFNYWHNICCGNICTSQNIIAFAVYVFGNDQILTLTEFALICIDYLQYEKEVYDNGNNIIR